MRDTLPKKSGGFGAGTGGYSLQRRGRYLKGRQRKSDFVFYYFRTGLALRCLIDPGEGYKDRLSSLSRHVDGGTDGGSTRDAEKELGKSEKSVLCVSVTCEREGECAHLGLVFWTSLCRYSKRNQQEMHEIQWMTIKNIQLPY